MADGMNCPSCDSEVPPGTYVCIVCGYDFVRGQRPDEGLDLPSSLQRLKAPILAAAALIVLALGGSFGYGKYQEASQVEPEPCSETLEVLRKGIDRKVLQGAKLEAGCPETPPGPISCWKGLGVKLRDFPTAPNETYELLVDGAAWEVRCHLREGGVETVWAGDGYDKRKQVD